MTAKKPANEAPAKAGATPHVETYEEKKERKRAAGRAAAAARNAATVVRHERHGKGIDQLFLFIDSYERFEGSRGNDNEQDTLEEFAGEARKVVDAMKRYLEHEVTKLEEAFDVHRPANYSRPQARRRFERMIPLVLDGRILRHHGAKADAALFEVLARIHGVGKNKAAEWYYERNKGIKPQPGKSRESLPRRLLPYVGAIEWDPAFLTSADKSGKTPAE